MLAVRHTLLSWTATSNKTSVMSPVALHSNSLLNRNTVQDGGVEIHLQDSRLTEFTPQPN